MRAAMGISTENNRGFTLIEIAIVILVVGLLAGGGISLMGTLAIHKTRNETLDYLQQSKVALISFARIHGRLPWADTDADGVENPSTSTGDLPYLTLRVGPTDPNRRVLRYAINNNLGTDRSSGCNALSAGLTGNPDVVDAGGVATAFSVAAILVGAGSKDSDNDGNVFDDINAGMHQGDNRDGNPNYLRHPPTDVFDDLVVYVGENELYDAICEYLTLAVNNTSSSTVYVHNRTTGVDLSPTLASGDSSAYAIISGTQIEIMGGPGGSGGTVASTPPTPITLAGHGYTVIVP